MQVQIGEVDVRKAEMIRPSPGGYRRCGIGRSLG